MLSTTTSLFLHSPTIYWGRQQEEYCETSFLGNGLVFFCDGGITVVIRPNLLQLIEEKIERIYFQK